MSISSGAEKNVLYTIWKSLKDREEFSGRREQYKSGHGRYDKDYFGNRSHGSYRPGGSNYGSGYKDKDYDESRGSQPKSAKCAQDNYTILGISRTATPSEIKKSYYKLAREHHPGRLINLRCDQSISNLNYFLCRQKYEFIKRSNTRKTRTNEAY